MRGNLLNPWANAAIVFRIGSAFFLFCTLVLIVVGVTFFFDKDLAFLDIFLEFPSKVAKEEFLRDPVFRFLAMLTFASIFCLLVIRFLICHQAVRLLDRLWKENTGQSQTVLNRIRPIVILLFANYFIGLAEAILQNVILQYPGDAVEKTEAGYALYFVGKTTVENYIVPDFSGITSLILGYLLYFFAKQLAAKSTLEKQVTALKEETQLTI